MSSNVSQKNKKKKISAMDSFYQGVIKGLGLDGIGTALGLGAAAYGIHKVNEGIANKLQKSFPKIHNIPKHAISGGLTGALLGGAGGAALAHGLSTIYGKPPVWAISPIMAGLLGAHGAAAGAFGGALKNYISNLLNPSKKKKSAKDRWFYDYADEKGNLPGITEIKMFAKHGHPNKQVESAAKNFQKTFGKTKMDDWKFGGFYGKSTLLPKDPKLHKQYEDALSKFFKKWEKTGYGNPYKQKSQTFNDWFY